MLNRIERKGEFMIVKLADRELRTKFGIFTEILFYDGLSESIALVMGNVESREDVLCRIHSACIGGHVFNSIECDCAAEMAAAQSAIQKAGQGIIIYLDQEGKGNGHLALLASIPFKKEFGQAEAYRKAGFAADARDYRPAIAILNEFKVGSIVLLTDNPTKADELRAAGISVSGTAKLESSGLLPAQ